MALSGTDASTTIDVVRILVAIIALGLASVSDIRTRRVPNMLWYIVAGIGVGLLVVDLSLLEGSTGWYLLLAFPVAAVFAVVVTGGELWPVMPADEEDQDRELTPSEARVYIVDLGVSVILLVASVAILVLAYDNLSDTGPYWYIVSSVMMALLLPLAFIVVSAVRGPLRFPEAIFGYPVPPDDVDATRMWLLYEAEEGSRELTRRLWPRRGKAADEARARALAILRDRHETIVYVSPKIPFMVPMLIGLILAIFLGNVITGLLWALLGA
jgi:preflagellin peptidase FlaK